jgi:hypothetical protein
VRIGARTSKRAVYLYHRIDNSNGDGNLTVAEIEARIWAVKAIVFPVTVWRAIAFSEFNEQFGRDAQDGPDRPKPPQGLFGAPPAACDVADHLLRTRRPNTLQEALTAQAGRIDWTAIGTSWSADRAAARPGGGLLNGGFGHADTTFLLSAEILSRHADWVSTVCLRRTA